MASALSTRTAAGSTPARDRRPARRGLAEALGTALLVATVVGSGIMAARLAPASPALALLANTIPTGAILVVLVTVLGPVSGAHLNPAVSVAMTLRGTLGRAALGCYVAAQVAGGVAGTLLAHLMFEVPLLQLGSTTRTGLGQWAGELVATFTLVLVILGTLRHRPEAVPWTVGLTITAAYWFTSSTSFANPAVTIARSLSDSFAGIAPADVPAFVLAQLMGALLALPVAACLLGEPVPLPAGAGPSKSRAADRHAAEGGRAAR